MNFLLRAHEETDARLAACLEVGVPVVSFHRDDASPYISRVHASGALAMYTVGSAAEARRAVDAGVDVVVAQGWEAGGHVRGEVATLPLIPRVVDAVTPTPVVAAGGIADGRGMAAALTLGAVGVWLGTRFMMSAEAATHPVNRERLGRANETDTVYTTLFDIGWPGAPHRALRNSTVTRWEAAGRPPSGQRPGEGDVLGHTADGRPILRYRSLNPAAGATGDIEAMSLYAGQSVGLVTQSQSASAIVTEIAEEAIRVLRRCEALVRAEGADGTPDGG